MIWAAVLPVALWALLRLLGIDSGFPLAPLMAFTPYVAIVALLVAGLALALRNWAAATVALAATLLLAIAVLPRAVGDGTVSANGRETFVVLAANVHYGSADPAALVALVDRVRPDVLSVEELTPSFARKLTRSGLRRRLPEAVLEAHRSSSGAGLYSRWPLRALPTPRHFFFRMPRAELRLPGGRRVRVVGVHPFPPETNNTTEWEEALAGLPSGGRGTPWVLAGDFNATLDQSQLRDLLDRGYRDAGDVAGEGLDPTFPAGGHLIPPVTIDHVLADHRLGIVSYSVEDIPGSDHRAVEAELALP
ncbi:MAG TPA: endonuclease/exonuclease/phosphatase family protein [Solirubrobacterales bacterium]|nr:endonuclease/exonuclease/phosphatase family protein [Solirubrobacterales bacterium]